MDSPSSPSLPSSFDPALEDHWEEQVHPAILPSSTNSDDFEALHIVHQETTAAKNKEGVVIQHRAWPLAEGFRSEGDHIDGNIVRTLFGWTYANLHQLRHCDRSLDQITPCSSSPHPYLSKCSQLPPLLHTHPAPLLLLPNVRYLRN